MCMIVKNEPLLEESILSFIDYVEELVIIDTGSNDNKTIEIAKKYADIFEQYSDCNDPETGLINDFSMARNKAFSLATKKWKCWADADDILVGAENFNALIENFEQSNAGIEAVSYLFPYEYSYDEYGNCTCKHYRERMFSDISRFKFVNPVHEVCIPNGDASNISLIKNDLVVYKHRRQFSQKTPETGRNLRILKKYFEKVGESDARQLYYLGLEYFNSGLLDESIKHLTRYIELSGWDDERVMACLKLIEANQAKNNFEECLRWAFKAIEIKETWSEGYFAAGKVFYFMAFNGGPNERKNWEKCVHFMRMGLSFPPTDTLLFINPLERSCEVYKYLNLALNKIGETAQALAAVNIGLKNHPEDKQLLHNKRIYEIFLCKNQIINNINVLESLDEIKPNDKTNISAIINKQPTNLIEKDKWNIPTNINLNEAPPDIDVKDMVSVSIMIWKQLMLRNQLNEAKVFLDNCISDIKNTDEIKQALDLTIKHQNMFGQLNTVSDFNKKKLNIVFYAGDGVEVWTPDTVKQTGIGGSELMLMHQAKNLAKLGHIVSVYNSCAHLSGIYDGVKYLKTVDYHDLNCDILIVSRRADALDVKYNVNATLKLLWVHDIFAINATNENLLRADRILALSDWHKRALIQSHNIHEKHVITTRNGIDTSRFQKPVKRNQYRCVNSSSPDRSWPILFEVWPKIKQAVPQAELHLYYGFKNWEHLAQFDSRQMDLINYLKAKINEMSSLGVVFHDRVNQDVLAEEFLGAGVWMYPTWFSETSCISAMEAQAAGLRIVSSSVAALNETVNNRGILIPGDWTSEEYKSKFIAESIKALNNPDDSDRVYLQDYSKNNFDLNELASDWETMFYNLLEEIKTCPIVPYMPTTQYRK